MCENSPGCRSLPCSAEDGREMFLNKKNVTLLKEIPQLNSKDKFEIVTFFYSLFM
ncbi:hypothetical protein BH09BAC5_BH09BAC5_23060 [soil metagenome]